MDMVTRQEWGAVAPRGDYTRVSSTKGVKVHYTGGYVPPRIVDDHRVCVAMVQQIQREHMAGAREVPYMDIGYSLVGCPHRKVFMGRGPHHLVAANGPGLNTGHYAVLGLVGNEGLTQPTAGLVDAIRDAIGYLRVNGNARNEIKGHRDGYATACPGTALYNLVKSGQLEPHNAAVTRPASASARKPYPGRPLKDGSRGADVQTWQAKLKALGYNVAADGIYGPLTEAATKRFQTRNGLAVDGVVGPATWTRAW